jgi:hypothetical protein
MVGNTQLLLLVLLLHCHSIVQLTFCSCSSRVAEGAAEYQKKVNTDCNNFLSEPVQENRN